jgi:hypothetical protein
MRRLEHVAGALLVCIARVGMAQAGHSAATVLELSASTRALGLGGAYAAVTGDESSLFYNPAQLPTAPRASAGLSAQRYVASSTLAALAAATHFGPGAAALGVQLLDYGSAEEVVCDEVNFPTCEGGRPTGGTVSASDLVVSGGYGLAIGSARVGAAAKLVHQRIVDAGGSAGALDLGVAYDLERSGVVTTLGIAVQNLGGSIRTAGTSSPLPRLVRLGAAVRLPRVGALDMTATAEARKSADGRTLPSGGTELSWSGSSGLTLTGRIGASALASGSDASPVTFGGSVAGRHVGLDYAYQGFDVLGATHRVGVRWWR